MARVLDATNLRKAYEGELALVDAELSVEAGEVHGLVGENGAGKSTLIKILAGVVRRDEGQIVVDGEPVDLSDDRESRACGFRFVHQDLGLVERLSVAENVFLGQKLEHSGGIYSARRTRVAAEKVLKDFVEVDPGKQISEISLAQRWLVGIARACDPSARLVVMDEPTVALSDTEVELVFAAIERLKASGVAVLFVSHRLNEILRCCDRVTVMKDGRTTGSHDIGELDHDRLVAHIVGEMGETGTTHHEPAAKAGEVVISTEDLCGGPLRNVNIEIRAGEILGLAGLVGSGRSSLLSTLFGAESVSSGKIFMDGKEVRFRTPHQSVKAGLAMIPEERRQQGLLMSRSIRENIMAAHIDTVRRFPMLPTPSRAKENAAARNQIQRLKVATRGPAEIVNALSGGNQQKVLLGRWLISDDLRVLLLDEPTKGIDVGAKAEFFQIARQLAREGVAVVLASSDLEEVADNSDRIVVLAEGSVAAVLSEPTTEGEILEICYGHRDTPQAAGGAAHG
jgi:ABC-type sugar transport system ATPase subunit